VNVTETMRKLRTHKFATDEVMKYFAENRAQILDDLMKTGQHQTVMMEGRRYKIQATPEFWEKLGWHLSKFKVRIR
jgi:hypothetical protein